jgi:hypothetical protein
LDALGFAWGPHQADSDWGRTAHIQAPPGA